MLLIGRLEAATVIHAEIASIVILFAYGDSLLFKDFFKEFEMDGLVINKDAVEIKNDRSEHA